MPRNDWSPDLMQAMIDVMNEQVKFERRRVLELTLRVHELENALSNLAASQATKTPSSDGDE